MTNKKFWFLNQLLFNTRTTKECKFLKVIESCRGVGICTICTVVMLFSLFNLRR
jgi:hypothetical protein